MGLVEMFTEFWDAGRKVRAGESVRDHLDLDSKVLFTAAGFCLSQALNSSSIASTKFLEGGVEFTIRIGKTTEVVQHIGTDGVWQTRRDIFVGALSDD